MTIRRSIQYWKIHDAKARVGDALLRLGGKDRDAEKSLVEAHELLGEALELELRRGWERAA